MMLASIGYEDIKIVENGRAALDEVQHSHYHLVFMDIMMPGIVHPFHVIDRNRNGWLGMYTKNNAITYPSSENCGYDRLVRM